LLPVLVVIVFFLFLLNIRTTFIAAAIAVLVITTLYSADRRSHRNGASINVMTLGGIAVAMGELVDDAIVDVENIFRRLSENNALPTPKPALLVVYEASREIRSAIVFGTAVVILAFMPLFALSGVEGRLFIPLGVALYRVDPGLPGRLADGHARLVLLLVAAVEGHASSSRRATTQVAEMGRELFNPVQHATGRRVAPADLGAGRFQRLAVDANGRRLSPEVR
jgi:hypothetical protein